MLSRPLKSRPRPQDAGAEEFKNAALLPRLGLQSTLIRHEHALRAGEFENAGFSF